MPGSVTHGSSIGPAATLWHPHGRSAHHLLHPDSEGNRLCGCSAVYTPATKRFTIGPAVEVHVWRSWSLESGFLYKRVNYNPKSDAFFIPRVESTGNNSGNSWEIPLLVRRRPLCSGAWEASLGAGPVLRVLGQMRQRYWETSRDFFGAVTLRRVSDLLQAKHSIFPGQTAAIVLNGSQVTDRYVGSRIDNFLNRPGLGPGDPQSAIGELLPLAGLRYFNRLSQERTRFAAPLQHRYLYVVPDEAMVTAYAGRAACGVGR